MKEINITGQKREALGKKASKQYRKEGLVPCNIYGEKKCENGRPVAMSFVAPMSELRKLVYTPHIYVVNLIIDGESHPAIMKELQFHPVTDALLHIDFYEVNDQKPIVMGVPVKLQGLAAGVRAGGRNEALKKCDYKQAIKVLRSIRGVGEKVANCVVLFGLWHMEAFPIDVWMKRALRENFPPDFDPETLGEYAGLAQQYIFYYARSMGREK